jgi:predicted TPR repeat methyltransferase
MMKHAAFKQDHIAEHYNELCVNYEDLYLRVGYHDPLNCAKLAHLYFGDEAPKVQVLDMGCGTGLVG